MGLQRRQLEAIVQGIAPIRQGQLGRFIVAPGVTLPDHPKESIERIADVGAGLIFFAGQLGRIEIAQAFEAIPEPVDITAHRRIAQIRPALHIKEKQQPVHVAQAFQRQGVGVGLTPKHALMLLLLPFDRLIAQQLDRAP